MSQSSMDDADSEKVSDHPNHHLSQGQEELIEATEPPFVSHDAKHDDANDAVDQEANGAELEKVASSKPSVNNIKSVPNGGLVAWLQVLGSFFLFFNTVRSHSLPLRTKTDIRPSGAS